MKIITNSAKETQKVAQELAENILNKENNNSAVILCLNGDLGSGKTTFTQGFARGLGIAGKILSPTFVILKKFKITNSKSEIPNHKFKNFYHIDCYRIKNEKDLMSLNFEDIINNPESIVLIEWPERIKKIVPNNSIKIFLSHLEGNKRQISY